MRFQRFGIACCLLFIIGALFCFFCLFVSPSWLKRAITGIPLNCYGIPFCLLPTVNFLWGCCCSFKSCCCSVVLGTLNVWCQLNCKVIQVWVIRATIFPVICFLEELCCCWVSDWICLPTSSAIHHLLKEIATRSVLLLKSHCRRNLRRRVYRKNKFNRFSLA